ncbi:trypsin-like peptidase domain-containing protein [Myxococcota bacterium]|nr:trypsin-like peptidase domain-containing protein [Myxococcota bacterium]
MHRRPTVLLCLVWIGACSGGTSLWPASATPSSGGDLESRIIEIAEIVKPSVVHIEAIVKINDRRKQVSGSGFVAHPDGMILTNHHVVDNAEKVSVSVPGHKKKYPARVVGGDVQTDVALLQVETDEPLEAASFGSSKGLRVGQWVLAIGNPYGLDGTVSLGIVSAKGRNLDNADLLNDFIQTDAMIDRGSSGGPLVDLDGKIVGINSRAQGRGISFTIPIETAQKVMSQIKAGGIERGFLGITMQPLDRNLANYFELPELTGVIINSIVENSPAQRAGLRTGDILFRFDGKRIEAEEDEDLRILQRRVADLDAGTKVEMEVFRDGEQVPLSAVVGPQPNVDAAEQESDLGFHAQEITAQIVRIHRLDTDQGAFVSFVAAGSPARQAGLRVGDVIERVKETSIADLDDLSLALDAVREEQRILFTTRRAERTLFILLERGTALPQPEPRKKPDLSS